MHSKAMRWLVFAMLAGACLTASPVLAVDSPVIAPYFVQWGVYDRNYHVTNIPADLVTHINYAFANPVYDEPTDSGAVVSFDTYADFEKMYPGDTWDQPLKGNINQLIKLKERYPHIKTLLSVGRWTLSDDFSDIAASTNARATFAQSCVAWITNYTFDGIDLDWEYPVEGGEGDTGHRPDDDANYVLLLEEIRSQLDALSIESGDSYLLTIASPCGYNTLTNRFQLTNMCAYLDWFNVMTYDMTGPWDSKTGHNSALYGNPSAPIPGFNIATSIGAYLSNGVPPSKIVLGLPFYGRGLGNVLPTDHGLFQTFSGASSEGSWEAGMFDFKDLRDGTRGHQYINNNGYTRYYDEVSRVPYLHNPAANIFITYDDEESIALKTVYAREQELAGVMCWSVDSDTDDYRLQEVIYRTLYPAILACGDNGAITLNWYALTNQTYTVDYCPSLSAGEWAECSTLVDVSDDPVSVVTGKGVRVQVDDTNTANATRGFYRVNLQTPTLP